MPIKAPDTRGTAINNEIKLLPIIKVVIMAIPIPTIPNMFPSLEEVGDDSPLNANIKILPQLSN